MGNVWRGITEGSGRVGAGVDVGTFGSVTEGSGVAESAIVASDLPGVANKSATTKSSGVAPELMHPLKAISITEITARNLRER